MHNNIKWLSFRCLCYCRRTSNMTHKKIHTQLIIMLVYFTICSTYRCTDITLKRKNTEHFPKIMLQIKSRLSANNFTCFFTHEPFFTPHKTNINQLYTHIYTGVCKQLSEPKKCTKPHEQFWECEPVISNSTIFYCKIFRSIFRRFILFEKYFW